MRRRAFLSLLPLTVAGCVVDRDMKFKFVTSGQNPLDAGVITQVIRGESLRPPAPVHLKGTRNAAGDLLIEWMRRERLPLPLRDYAGTPLSEEREIYVIEIYSGSTLKRTIRHAFIESAWPAVMESTGSDKYAHISSGGNTFLYTASSASARIARSVQHITSPSANSFVEMTLIATGDALVIFGVIPANLLWTTATYLDGFTAWLSGTGGGAALTFKAGNTTLYTEDATAYAATGVRVRIDTYGDRVVFTKTPLGAGAQPTALSTTAPTFPLRAWGEISIGGLSGSSTGKAQDIIMRSVPRGYNYTAAQQTEDFGSTQSSIKVRVYQESAIVGKGNYTEANL